MEYFLAFVVVPAASTVLPAAIIYQCINGLPQLREDIRLSIIFFAALVLYGMTPTLYYSNGSWLDWVPAIVITGYLAVAWYQHPWRKVVYFHTWYANILATDPLPNPAQFKASLPSDSPWSEQVNTLMARLYADEWPSISKITPPFPTTVPDLPPFSICVQDPATVAALEWYVDLETTIKHFEAAEDRLKDITGSVTRLFQHALPIATEGPFRVHINTTLPNTGWLVGEVAGMVLLDEQLKKVGFAKKYRAVYGEHLKLITRMLTPKAVDEYDWLFPDKHPGSPQVIIDEYLYGTPLRALFNGTIPLGYKRPRTRFEHTWIVAPPDSGKTTLLQAMIADDLAKVARGECSIIVMDSQEVMLNLITNLKLFETMPLDVIDPGAKADFAINPFAIQAGDDAEADDTHLIEVFEYMLSDILKADLTAKQTGLFVNIVRALMNSPDATIPNMLALLEGTYTPNYAGLDEETAKFMKGPFLTKEKEDTGPKGQLAWRIRLLLQRSLPLQRMLSHTRSDINFATQMNTPSVTLIRTNKDLLGNAGVEFFGRFCIAQILRAAYARAGDGSPLPCYVYIDEAQEYIKEDPQIPDLLDQVRKRNVGFVFANQRINHLKGDVLDAMSQDVGTIIASRVRDANALAKWMECKPPDLITKCQQGEWMLFIRGQTDDAAVRVTVDRDAIERLPRRQAQEVRRQEPRVLRADRRPPPPVKESEEILTEPEDQTAPRPP